MNQPSSPAPQVEDMGAVDVAIVGGGVAGLATALSLQQRGVDAVVFEQAAALTEVGAGFMLSPNATRILDRLGVLDAVRPAAVAPTAMTFRSWHTGSIIKRDVMGDATVERFGAPQLGVHRAALVDVLAGALNPGSVQLSSRFESLEQSNDFVDVTFAEGKKVRASAVIGADGYRSPVASAIGVSTTPQQSTYACFRALIPSESIDHSRVDEDWTVWLGPQQHLVHYYISSGRYLNLVAFVPLPAEDESWTTQGDPAVLRQFFTGWHPSVQSLLDAVEQVSVWGLYERRARDRWSEKNVGVIGDAAHPMLPFFAQGAAQAIEDAALVGYLLPDALRTGQQADALSQIAAQRLERVRRIQALASGNATLFHFPDGPAQQERDRQFADPSGETGAGNSSWVFAHDVVPI